MTPAELAVEIVKCLIDNMISRRELRRAWYTVGETVRKEIRGEWEHIVLDVLLGE